MYTISQAAHELSIPVDVLRNQADAGRIRTRQHLVGGQRYITPEDLATFKTKYVDPVRGRVDGNV